MKIIDLEGHWQPVPSANLATVGLIVYRWNNRHCSVLYACASRYCSSETRRTCCDDTSKASSVSSCLLSSPSSFCVSLSSLWPPSSRRLSRRANTPSSLGLRHSTDSTCVCRPHPIRCPSSPHEHFFRTPKPLPRIPHLFQPIQQVYKN